jgi:4-hydroxy-2-oxoglutarate aldolase
VDFGTHFIVKKKDIIMNKHRDKLSGIFAPVVTPFINQEIQLDHLRYNLQKLNKTLLAGYLALGSNGEFKSMSDDEQLRVLQVFAEEKSDKTIMVGTGRESTFQTIQFSKRVAEFGFDYVSVLTPHYFASRMDQTTLLNYYLQIADNSPLPVLLYNAPKFANGVSLSVETVLELAEHPNILGIKDSSSQGPAQYLAKMSGDEDFYILAGSINSFYPTLHLGAVGGIVSLANALPNKCVDLYDSFVHGDFKVAERKHFKLSHLNKSISGLFGVCGVKAAMNLRGFKGDGPRHPLVQLNPSEIKNIADALELEGF